MFLLAPSHIGMIYRTDHQRKYQCNKSECYIYIHVLCQKRIEHLGIQNIDTNGADQTRAECLCVKSACMSSDCREKYEKQNCLSQ